MAKSKKNRQADFQKVKLKVGKKLKKADNVTKTNFKTRKIQITQQLKTGEETAHTTKKRQNVMELFTQCRHYSVAVRQDAVTGLKELVTSFPDTVHSHLADLLEKTAELLTDKDPKVRQGAVRLLKICLSKISEKLISPFFPLLCAHLCCAMTHIVDEIQVDSLPVLDVLLEQYPKLIISASNQVLSNFIEQISRQKGQGDTKRSLSTNPNSRTSSQKWRKSVFDRLQKFLKAMLNCGTNTFGIEKDENDSSTSFSVLAVNRKQAFPGYFQNYWESPGLTLSSDITDHSSGSAGLIGDRLQDFATTLMPLMLECWVEAAPSQNAALESGSQVLPENAAAMYSILQVTQSLMEAMDTYCTQEDHDQWPRTKYMKDCSKHFLSNFPYDVYTPVSKGDFLNKKEKKDFVQVSSEDLNLTICEIMSRFLPEPSATRSPQLPPWLGVISLYLQEYLEGKYNRRTIFMSGHTVVKIANRLIQAGIDDESLANILSAMFRRYKGVFRRSLEKQIYLQFFASILLDNKRISVMGPEMQQTFLQSLPHILPLAVQDQQKMAVLVISVLKQAACQQCLTFNQSDIDKMKQWFDPENGLVMKVQVKERKGLLSLLYSMPEIGMEFTRILILLARHEALEESETAFLIQTLQNRYIRYGETPGAARSHITLLSQLVFGMTKEEIKLAVTDKSRGKTCDGYSIITSEHQPLSWRRHDHIVQIVCDVLGQCRNSTDISNIIFTIIETFLRGTKTVPLQVVFGICRFASQQTICSHIVVPVLINLCTATIVSSMHWHDQDSHDPDLLGKLQETSCGLILNLPGGFELMIAQFQRIPIDSSPDITALVKSMHMILSYTTQQKVAINRTSFINLLDAVKHKAEQLYVSQEASASTDTVRLIAELEYSLTHSST